MCMYIGSRENSHRSDSKSELQMFSLISGRHVGVPRKDSNMVSHTELYKFPWNVSANNSRTLYCTVHRSETLRHCLSINLLGHVKCLASDIEWF